MHSLDDRLRALAEGLEDARPASTERIGRRATQLRRRRRLAATSGAVAAGLIVVVGAYAAFGWADRAGDVTTIDQPPTTEPAPTTASTLPRDTTSTTATEPDTTTPPPAAGPAAAGSLESATPAIRAACRQFYGSGLGEPELAGTCDQPRIEFRSDCYADRPATFVPGEGGCAYLGGYLAVFHGQDPQADGSGDFTFPVGDDVWFIHPESD
jgi:hypothetical protein